MQKQIAIERYEQLILKKDTITLNGNAQEKTDAAKMILRYAISELLGWSPEVARDHLTWEIMKAMKLDRILRYIPYPPDVEKEKDPEYAVYLAFPEFGFDIRRQIMREYKRILNGELEEFPKKIFDGPRGREKASILLNELIPTNLAVDSVEGLYARFADTPKANRMLNQWRIASISRKLYCTPLDYLHYSLPEEEKDEFLYTYYQYRNVARTVKNMDRFAKRRTKNDFNE